MFKKTLIVTLILLISVISFAQVPKKVSDEQKQIDQLLDDAQKNVVRDTLKANQALQKAIQLSAKYNLNKNLGKVYSIKGEMAGRASRFKDALAQINKALDIYTKAKDTMAIAHMHNNLGNIYERLSNIKQSEASSLYAIKLYQQLKNEEAAAKTMMNLGITYFRIQDYKKGVAYAFESLKIREKLNNETDLAYSYSTIGTMYLYSNKPEESIEYNKKSMRIADKTNDNYAMANDRINIGKAYFNLNNYVEAKKYALQSLPFSEKIGNKRGLRHAYELLSGIAENEKNIEEAISWKNKAIEVYKNTDDAYTELVMYMNRHKLFLLQKKYKEAEADLLMTEKIAKKQNMKEELEGIKRSQVILYTAMGKADEAKAAFEQFEKYKDSSLNVTSLQQINEYKTKYETEKKQSRIDFLTSQNTIQSLNLKNKTLALNASELQNERNELDIRNKALDLEHKNTTIQQKELKAKNDAQQISLLNEQSAVQGLQLKNRNQTIAIISGLLFILAIIATGGFILFRNFRAKAKLKQEQLALENKLLEEQANAKIQEQRLEISRELHDSLGSQLTFISSILDGMKNSPAKMDETVNSKINTLSDFSENSINELKNTIWALNAKELKLDDLKMKLLNFIKNAAEAKEDVRFNFDFDVANNFQLNSKQAINLFRAFQEIINNALKYAKAKNISASVKQNGNNLKIGIADDGIGFNMAEAEQKSYGIGNIKSRIAEINGKLNINTAPNKGTNYQIEIGLI